jgi:membrane protease YdiL (CAAX protease family)
MTLATVAGTSTARFLVAAAIAATVSLLLYFPDRGDESGAIVGGLSALIGVAIGLAAVVKYRPLRESPPRVHVRRMALTLGLGVGLGLANLLVNYGMAVWRPAIYEQMVSRWALFSPWSIVIAGPIIEEIAYRLVLLSVFAWVVARFTDDPRRIFYTALGLSSSLFGLAHIFYGGVDDPLYALGTAVKNAGAGVLLGWVFWRRGLPYSIVCHAAANATHLLLMPLLFNL